MELIVLPYLRGQNYSSHSSITLDSIKLPSNNDISGYFHSVGFKLDLQKMFQITAC